MDETDKQLIAILSKNGRINNKDIAGQLSVSEGTVRNRIKKLVSSRILKISGLINSECNEEKQLVFLGVKIAVSRDLEKKAGEISALPGVHSVHIVTGRYDLIVEVWVETKSGMIDFLSKTLASVDEIVSTESFLAMKSINKWIPGVDIQN